jgi:GTPase SAR1 family protein
MSRFTNDTFEESSKTTIGVAFATKNMAVETAGGNTAKETKKQVKLQVWDTGTRPFLPPPLLCLLLLSCSSSSLPPPSTNL